MAACSADTPHPAGAGQLAGQVVVSGPLRGAKVSVDQLDYSVKSSVAVRAHLADTTTDEDGRFSVDTGTYSGLLLVTARGGSFIDLATGAIIQLDPTAGLESIEPLELLEQRDDSLVSPVGHLIAARTRSKMAQLHDIVMAERDAEDHLGRHFGNVSWMRVRLASLDVPAASPTESVRAALVQDALSFLAQDIARQAGASPQEVNVLTLTQQLALDIGQGQFDGNDGNSPTYGDGLQVGVCPPVTDCSAPAANSCALGACRALCDLYAGTPRSLLAGEVTKVIRSSAINHTGLLTSDILAVARSMADDLDDDLFGNACLESLDRVPPSLNWTSPTPSEAAYISASFSVKAIAVDDVDPRPQVFIDGYQSELGDSAASAMIDSTRFRDGALPIVAEAHDMAGNITTIQRTVRVDNTPPALTLDPTGYVRDATTWWTATETPILAGTVTDDAPVSVIMSTTAGSSNATVVTSSWSGTTAAPLDLAGADVTVAAIDAAGNRTQIMQHIRADITPPELSFEESSVRDEASENVTFDTHEAPVHVHTGTKIDLTTSSSCPAVTKFSYLLAGTTPYGSEVTGQGTPDPNPVHYVLRTFDDGVGIVTGSIEYRVGLQTSTGTTWLLDWTSATGTPTANAGEYDVKILSDQVPQLATTEGVYIVGFHATDRLARTTAVTRCFDLHLRAPPLHFQTPGEAGDPIPSSHTYALSSLALGNGPIAARLLNNNATGASLMDEDITNGTASTVYLDIQITRPTQAVTAGQQFEINRTITNTRSVTIDCTHNPGSPPPLAICNLGDVLPYTSVDTGNQPVNNPNFFVKVFELDSNLAPATEVPCQSCGASDHWTFAIPPRSGSSGAMAPARRFKAMTMIGQVAQLWPSDNVARANPPFQDTALNNVMFTGFLDDPHDGCVFHNIRQLPNGRTIDTCTSVETITPFRALISARLTISDRIESIYSTAPTSTATPENSIRSFIEPLSWSSSQTQLPM